MRGVFPPRTARQGALPPRYGLIALASGFLLVGGLCSLPVHPPTQGLRSVLTPLCTLLGLACALLAGIDIAAPAAWRRLYARWRAAVLLKSLLLATVAVAVFAGGAFLTLFVPLSRSYWSDVISFSYVNAHLVMQGDNPYTNDAAFPGALAQFPNAIETPVRHGQFGNGYDYPSLTQIEQVRAQYVTSPDNRHGEFDPRTLHSYPALSFLIYVPLLRLGIDNILLLNLVVFWGLFAWLLWLSPVGWRHWAALVAGTAVAAVLFSLFLETEVICVALLLAAWHLRQRHPSDNPWTAPVLLGLACAFKQYSWFFLPFFALEIWMLHGGLRGWRASLRFGLVALGAFLAPNLPFIVASPAAWGASILEPMTAPLFPDGMGIINLSIGHLLPYGPPTLYGALEVLALVASLVAFVRWRGALGDAALLLAVVPLFFAFRSAANYFAFVPWIALYAANCRYTANMGARQAPDWALRAQQLWERAVARLVPLIQHAYAFAGLPAGDVLVAPNRPALLPLEGQGGGHQDHDSPAEEQQHARKWRAPWAKCAAQRIGQRRRWERPRHQLQRAWQALYRQEDIAHDQEQQEEAIGRRQRRLRAQRPSHQHAEAREASRPQQHDQEGEWRRALWAPAVEERREREQQRDL
jgi:hypothetical protein